MAYKVERVRNGGFVESYSCHKTLDDAMRKAAMDHEDGKGYRTDVLTGRGELMAQLFSNHDPVVYVDRYVLMPIETGDWRKKPTRYDVYKRL